MSLGIPTYELPLIEGTSTSRPWYRFWQNLDVLIIPPTTGATLPVPANPGVRGFVTDASSITFLANAVGGGVNTVPVVWTGTKWVIG